MAEEPQSTGEATSAQAAAPSFLRKTWPLLAFTAGCIVFAASVLVWRGPLRDMQRNAALADFDAGQELYEQGKYRESLIRLESVVPRLWRIPEKRGVAFFLIGSANNILSERAGAGEGSEYRRWSLPYLQEAKVIGVPSEYALPAAEQLGVSLADVGQTNEAIASLEDAVRLRRQREAVILRRLLQATVHDAPVDPIRATLLARQWATNELLPTPEHRLADQALKAAQAKDTASLKALVDGPEFDGLIDGAPQPLLELDVQADVLLSFEGPKAALERLQQEREENNRGLANLYRRLAGLFASLKPPELSRAIAYAKLRVAIEGSSVGELDDARRRLAELYLDDGKPLEARAVLSEASAKSLPAGVHAFLLGRSYFEEGRQVASSSLEAWLSGNPARTAMGKYYNALGRRLRVEAADGETKLPAWMRTVEPIRLKQFAARADMVEAAACFRAVLADREVDDETYLARSLLYLGQAYSALGRYPAADETFERAMTGFPGTVFDEAARFLRVDAVRRSDPRRLLESLRSASSLAAERRHENNPYLTVDQIRGVFRDAWRTFQEQRRYDEAIEAARLFVPFAPPAAAEQMLGESARDGAAALTRLADQQEDAAAQAALARARRMYREAGDAFYAAAAANRASADFTELLWQATLASYQGHAYAAVVARDEEFLAAHAGGPLDFSARLLLARTRMGLREFPAARDILEDALVRHPRSPYRFEGRMALAQCFVELARQTTLEPADAKSREVRLDLYRQAQGTLEKNTDGFDLEPTAADWRKSLFQLGELLREMGEYDAAISRLDEAIRRYPTASETSDAMYSMAQAYLASARKPAELAAKDATLRGREFYTQERNRRLDKALTIFTSLARRIADLQEQRPLTAGERILLRNSYFAVGQVYMELEDYPAAINAYTTAASRFQNRPECLGAYLQIANAYWKTNRSDEALSTLRQAQWVLGQLAPEMFRESALSKDQWVNRLALLVGAGQGKGSL